MLTRLLTALGAVSMWATTGHAQDVMDVMDVKSATEVRARYIADLTELHDKVVGLAKAFPEETYAWRPGTGVRSVSEALMHIASEWYFFTPRAVGGGPPADFGVPRDAFARLEKISKKSEVLAELDKSWAHCKQQLEGSDVSKLTTKMKGGGGRDVTFPEMAFVMTGDLHEHLGQLIAYARMNKIVPPWSK